MSELWIMETYGRPFRGLASDSGFEEEDAERARTLAQNDLNSQFYRTMREVEKLGDLIWLQDKARRAGNQKDFVDRLSADMEMVAREFANDGVLPALKPG